MICSIILGFMRQKSNGTIQQLNRPKSSHLESQAAQDWLSGRPAEAAPIKGVEEGIPPSLRMFCASSTSRSVISVAAPQCRQLDSPSGKDLLQTLHDFIELSPSCVIRKTETKHDPSHKLVIA
jgi:hypothetical protein